MPTNPIRWSLALDPEAAANGGPVSAFGAGFFDDAGDIPGQPVIWFTLRGTFDPAPESRAVTLTKVYERPVEMQVAYKGKLHALNGKPEITGTWDNASQGTRVGRCKLNSGVQALAFSACD